MEKREGVESIVREIKRKTRRRYNSEEKIRITREKVFGVRTLSTEPGSSWEN